MRRSRRQTEKLWREWRSTKQWSPEIELRCYCVRVRIRTFRLPILPEALLASSGKTAEWRARLVCGALLLNVQGNYSFTRFLTFTSLVSTRYFEHAGDQCPCALEI
jgi:hypothetical protein